MNQFQEYRFIKNRFKKDNDYLIKKYIKSDGYQGLITDYSNETYPILMKHKNMMIKIFFLVIIPIGVIGAILYFVGIPWIIIWSGQLNLSEGLIPGIATLFFGIFILSTIIFFIIDVRYVTKRFHEYFQTFQSLRTSNYIDVNINNYSEAIQMCYFYDNKVNWRTTHPNSYPNFNYYLCTQSLAIFIDKLKDYQTDSSNDS